MSEGTIEYQDEKPGQPPGANEFYEMLAENPEYHAVMGTRVEMVFEDTTNRTFIFQNHAPTENDVRIRKDGKISVENRVYRLSIYPPSKTGEASVSVTFHHEGVQRPSKLVFKRGELE